MVDETEPCASVRGHSALDTRKHMIVVRTDDSFLRRVDGVTVVEKRNGSRGLVRVRL